MLVSAPRPRGETLIHYSREPIGAVRSVEQPTTAARLHDLTKPEGLWVAADGGWAMFCKSIGAGLGEYVYKVKLKPDANVLRIADGDALELFAREFGGRSPALESLLALEPGAAAAMRLHDVLADMAVDWPGVAARWQGIIIAPHINTMRFRLEWYYSWDCASGCIWDAAAVASITRVALERPLRLKRARKAGKKA